MGTYKELLVWQKANQLSDLVYRVTDKLSKDERYNLVSQMRRAAVSITSNLAEGSGSSATGDQLRYYGYAYASAVELESQIRTLESHGLAPVHTIFGLDEAIGHVFRLLHLLRKSLKNRGPNLKT